MPPHDSNGYTDPPDLLRRFVPTPFSAVFPTGFGGILIQTNDPSLLPGASLDTAAEVTQLPTMKWKLVRDLDASGPLQEPIILSSPPLTIITMGMSCLAAFDRDRGELLGFIGAGVDALTYREVLLPFLFQISDEMFSRPPDSEFFSRSEMAADD